MSQPGFFDINDRLEKLGTKDPLVGLNALIDWEGFRSTLDVIRNKKRKSRAGRKPYDVVLMFKVLVLQHLYNLSDEPQPEYLWKEVKAGCNQANLLKSKKSERFAV